MRRPTTKERDRKEGIKGSDLGEGNQVGITATKTPEKGDHHKE